MRLSAMFYSQPERVGALREAGNPSVCVFKWDVRRQSVHTWRILTAVMQPVVDVGDARRVTNTNMIRGVQRSRCE